MRTDVRAPCIGIIASLKKGFEPFIHAEVTKLVELGNRVIILPTKVGPGLFPPDPAWRVLNNGAGTLLRHNLSTLFRRPGAYLRLLGEAFKTGGVVEFLLAAGHADEMSACDVIYATFADRKLFVGYFLKKLHGTPLAVTIHAYELYDNPNPELFSRAIAVCDRISTVTEYNRQLLVEEHGQDREKVHVNRIAVDTERYRPRATFVVLVVSFFNRGKGHDDLLEAIKRLDDPNLELWVVGGEGPGISVDVRGIAQRLGLTDRVAFFGPLRGPALEALYRRCDVFCLPSKTAENGVKEGFPTVIAEAMSFGKPVISTRHAEIPNVLDEVLIDEGDVDGLVAAIKYLRDDREARERIGAANRRKAERLFTFDNIRVTSEALSELAHTRVTGRPGTAVRAPKRGEVERSA